MKYCKAHGFLNAHVILSSSKPCGSFDGGWYQSRPQDFLPPLCAAMALSPSGRYFASSRRSRRSQPDWDVGCVAENGRRIEGTKGASLPDQESVGNLLGERCRAGPRDRRRGTMDRNPSRRRRRQDNPGYALFSFDPKMTLTCRHSSLCPSSCD